MICYGMSGIKYTLGKCIGRGGEGEIYEIVSRNNYVAKLYSEKKFSSNTLSTNPRDELCEKIITMINQKINPYVNGVLTVAWPQDALFDINNKFVGYIMHKTDSKYHLFDAARKRERENLFPKYNWKTAVTLAYNLALVTKRLHDAGVVIGDFNSNNIMINKEGYVTLIDTDSYTIRNNQTGKVYKCTVGVPDVLAPELQGKNLASRDSTFSKETDRFALAVHIFILLANNCHPFGYLDSKKGVSASAGNLIVNNIVNGTCPYVSKSPKGSPAAPEMSIFPKEIFKLFQDTFLYDKSNATNTEVIKRRTSAEVWQNALGNLLTTEMKCCKNDKNHLYPTHLNKCPWCEIEKRVSKSTNIIIRPDNSHKSVVKLSKSIIVQNNIATPQQELAPLMIASILIGVLFGIIAGPYIGEILNSEFQIGLDNGEAVIISGLVGGISGIPVALLFRKQYCAMNKMFPGIMLSLLSPVSFVAIGLIVTVAIYVICMIIAGIMTILAVVAAVAIIAAVFSNC